MSITDVLQVAIVLFLLMGLFARLAEGGTKAPQKAHPAKDNVGTVSTEINRVEPDIGAIHATDQAESEQPRLARKIHSELALRVQNSPMAKRIASQDKLVSLQRKRALFIAANTPRQPKVIGR